MSVMDINYAMETTGKYISTHSNQDHTSLKHENINNVKYLLLILNAQVFGNLRQNKSLNLNLNGFQDCEKEVLTCTKFN